MFTGIGTAATSPAREADVIVDDEKREIAKEAAIMMLTALSTSEAWHPRYVAATPCRLILCCCTPCGPAPAEKIRRVLNAAMDALADARDWTEIERLVRGHLSVPDALKILEKPGTGGPGPGATPRRPSDSRRKRGP